MTESLTISSHDELIATIPHTLGFTPANSMVCLAVGGGPTARVDLPTYPEEMGSWVQVLTDVYLDRHHPPRVALVAYGEDARRSIEALAALREALAPDGGHGPEIGPLLWVNGDEWTDLLTGTRGTVSPSARARIDAEFAVRGRVMPARGREQLAIAMQGDPTGVSTCLPAAWERFGDLGEAALRGEVGWMGTRLDRFHRDREYLSDVDAARVLVAISDTGIRDATVLAMRRQDAPVFSEFWQDLVRRAPAEVRDTPATLLALTSFLEGRGANAWVALDEVSQGNELGNLIAAALTQAVDPREWDKTLPAATGSLLQRAALGEAAGPGRHVQEQATSGPAADPASVDRDACGPAAGR
jgi:hypothetical protein